MTRRPTDDRARGEKRRWWRFRRRGPKVERIRPTKVGFWYVLGAVVVGVAATNTGNNALYIVLAVMLGLLVVTGILSRQNLYRLEIDLEAPGDVYAKVPFHLRVEVRNRSRWMPRWLLVLATAEQGQPLLVPYLPAAGRSRGFMEMLVPRRGIHRFESVRVSSIFPVGFFHKAVRYPSEVEVLVYPEIFPAGARPPVQVGVRGDGMVLRAGWGYDLHALREFRPGDDPRAIHWKQTARTGALIYTEREAEDGARLSIVFDNAVGGLSTPAEEARFEQLVSEAATAAVDFLGQGFAVELVTRDLHVPFATGPVHRRRILEHLALVAPRPVAEKPLVRPGGGPELRLGMEVVA